VFVFVLVLLFWSCMSIAVTQPPGTKPARVPIGNERRHIAVDVQTEAPGTQCKAQSRTQSPHCKHLPCNRVKCIIRHHFLNFVTGLMWHISVFFLKGKELLESERTVR